MAIILTCGASERNSVKFNSGKNCASMKVFCFLSFSLMFEIEPRLVALNYIPSPLLFWWGRQVLGLEMCTPQYLALRICYVCFFSKNNYPFFALAIKKLNVKKKKKKKLNVKSVIQSQ